VQPTLVPFSAFRAGGVFISLNRAAMNLRLGLIKVLNSAALPGLASVLPRSLRRKEPSFAAQPLFK
jgi:hypothetical protein